MNIENLKTMPVVGDAPAVRYMTQAEYDAQLASLQEAANDAMIAEVTAFMDPNTPQADRDAAQQAKAEADALLAEFQNDLASGAIVIGEAPASSSKIKDIAEAVKASNDDIKAELTAEKEAQQAAVAEDAMHAKSETNQHETWKSQHTAAMNQDTKDLESEIDSANAQLDNLVSNSEGIVDSISEFAADLESKRVDINSDVADRKKELQDSRDAFEATMGLFSDLGMTLPATGAEFVFIPWHGGNAYDVATGRVGVKVYDNETDELLGETAATDWAERAVSENVGHINSNAKYAGMTADGDLEVDPANWAIPFKPSVNIGPELKITIPGTVNQIRIEYFADGNSGEMFGKNYDSMAGPGRFYIGIDGQFGLDFSSYLIQAGHNPYAQGEKYLPAHPGLNTQSPEDTIRDTYKVYGNTNHGDSANQPLWDHDGYVGVLGTNQGASKWGYVVIDNPAN